jgi:hypothetical protein
LACACFLPLSCEPDPELAHVDVVQFDQAQFDRERAAWNASNVKNYHFNMYVDGMASRSIIRFVIENGAFKERQIIQTGKHDYVYSGGFTIPAFYAEIERTVQDARKQYDGRNPDEIRFSINVAYNTRHHFPVSIQTCELHAVGNNNFEGINNGGITRSIRDFERGN